jgi:hypothetical protein
MLYLNFKITNFTGEFQNPALRTPVMSREEELLILCSRLRGDPEVLHGVRRLVQEGIAWDYLLNNARRHGLIPLVYHHLNAACPEMVPQAAWESLKEAVQRNAAWNMLLTVELRQILSEFEAEGIRAVPYKGPALAVFVYGSLSLRQFVDLDLLIHRQDFHLAAQLLISQGYHPVVPLSGSQEEALLKWYHHCGFIHETKGIMVEIHWEITRWFLSLSFDVDDIWQRLETRRLMGKAIFNLSPEDLLLVLCVHSESHRWERLSWIADVAALIEVYPHLDWEKTLNLAGRMRCERMLFLGLSLAQELPGASLPRQICQGIKADPAIPSLTRKVRRRLFGQETQSLQFMPATRFHLQTRARLWDKIRHLFHAAFSPSDEDLEFASLPAQVFFLYYLLRPVRLIGKHLLKIDFFPKK